GRRTRRGRESNHGFQMHRAQYSVPHPLPGRQAGGTDRRLQAEGLPPTENRRRHLTFTRTGVDGLRWAPRSSKPVLGILGDVEGRIVPVAPPPFFNSNWILRIARFRPGPLTSVCGLTSLV